MDGTGAGTDLTFSTALAGGTCFEKMRITDTGNVGIGTDSPSQALHIADSGGSSILEIQRTDSNVSGTVGAIQFNANDDHAVSAIVAVADGDNEGSHLTFNTTSAASANSYFTSTTERMRVTSGGEILFGKTAEDNTTQGIRIDAPFGLLSASRDGNLPLLVNRNTSDGTVVDIRKDGTSVGVIGTQNWGIGTSSPAAQLELEKSNSTAIASGTAPHGLALSYGTADGNNAGLWFSPAFGDDQGIAGISSQRVSGYQTDLRFYTNNTNSARSFSERLIIDQLGRHAMGNTPSISNNYILSIDSDASGQAAGIHFTHGTKNLYLGYAATTATDNAEMWNAANGYLRFGTNNSERMRITSSGVVNINHSSGALITINLVLNKLMPILLMLLLCGTQHQVHIKQYYLLVQEQVIRIEVVFTMMQQVVLFSI